MGKNGLLLSVIIVVAAGGFWAPAAAQESMSVQVKTGEVRLEPSFLGRIIQRLSYGDRVTVVQRREGWARVSAPGGATGWIHGSALTPKKIVLRPGASDVRQAATSDELALAGKGFNSQVESAFKQQNPNLDFGWIDRMERITVSQREMERFLREGRVTPEGGVR